MLLAQKGHEVLLVDRARFPREKTCGDGLTPRAAETLRRLGLETKVASCSHKVKSARMYAPSGQVVTATFASMVHHLPPHGYVIPRIRLDDILRHEAQKAGADFLSGTKVEDFLWNDGTVQGIVARSNGSTRKIRANIVVVATGASMHLPKRLGIAPASTYDVLAVRGYWEGVEGLDDALEFHLPPQVSLGYVWLFPVGNDIANIGICFYRLFGAKHPMPSRAMKHLIESYPNFRKRLRQARPTGKVKGYPIRTDFPKCPILGPGWLAVGEATGLVNPVTGEGIDLAMESGELAAKALHKALKAGRLDMQTLKSYRQDMNRQFAGMFRGLRIIRSLIIRPKALEIYIRQANRHPGLFRRVFRIMLGAAPVYEALFPSTWWWFLKL